MRDAIKTVETRGSDLDGSSVYHQMALTVRDLLKSECALVATVDAQSIRIQAIAPENGLLHQLITDVTPRMHVWGPILMEDARLAIVPVTRSGNVIGLLAGYSPNPGAFSDEDLERLTFYSHIASDIFQRDSMTSFSNDELLHVARLLTIGELSACLAHEITNPLMLIRGHLTFIEESLPADHPLRSNFEVIDRASRRIEETAKRMLDFSRKRSIQPEECRVEELIQESLRFMEPYFNGQRIEVKVNIEPDPPMVRMDRWHMIQVLTNLLQNAADAMSQVDRRVLTISVTRAGDELRIALSDTGKGIAESDLPRVFQRFFTTKGESGTGLGLYVAQRVIQEHRGTITAETSEHGTSFVISLPL